MYFRQDFRQNVQTNKIAFASRNMEVPSGGQHVISTHDISKRRLLAKQTDNPHL